MFQSELNFHKMIHQRIPTFKCMSKNCKKVYKSPNELNKHVLKHSEWFGIMMKKTAVTLRMTVETYVHTKGNIKKLEVLSAYHAINSSNTLCSSKDIKLSWSVRPRGLTKVWNVVLYVITCQLFVFIELNLDKHCCNIRG